MNFTVEEQTWAPRFRQEKERPTLDTNLYIDNIEKAGLEFNVPQTDEELVVTVNRLLGDRKLLPRLFAILVRDFGISPATAAIGQLSVS